MTHKIRPSADRLVEWSPEEEARMHAVMKACVGFIESRFPGEQPCYEETTAQPMRYANRWYYDNVTAQQDEPTPDRVSVRLEEHIDEIRKMCADPGYSNADIAARFGCVASTLAWFAKKHNIKVTRYNPALRVVLDNRQKIKRWLAQGIKRCQIAAQLHVDANTLSTLIKKHNLKPKKRKLKK